MDAAKARKPGKGKGKALNAIAAASGRDPASIVKSVEEAELAVAAKAAKHEEDEEAKRIEEEQANIKAKEEVSTSQIFNKLSPQQQYQYECFRRCGFASKPIEKFVAKTLVDEAHQRYLARRGAMLGLGRMQSSDIGNSGYGDGISNDLATITDVSDTSDSTTFNQNKKRRKYSTKHLLKEESKRRRVAIDQPPPYFLKGSVGNGSSGVSGLSSGEIPPLSNLVVPNSSSEIVAVVSSMAKCYAQRLVSAAKRVADAEEEGKKMEGTSTSVEDAPQKPLEPHHFLEAHRHRQSAGLDGFWMANPENYGTIGLGFNKGTIGVVEAAALGTIDRDRFNYLAALEAQEVVEKKIQKITEQETQQKDEMNDEKMDVEDSKGSETKEKEASSAGAATT